MDLAQCLLQGESCPGNADIINCPIVGEAETFCIDRITHINVRVNLREYVRRRVLSGKCKKLIMVCKNCNKCLPPPA